MEENMIELPDKEFLEVENLTEKLSLTEKLNELISENSKKSVEELKQEEEMLISSLNKLKKDNFQLEITLNAWKTTFKTKQEEFKEAQLQLDEIHNAIQFERENYCSKLDIFNEKYGILSDWWKKQMDFKSEMKKLEEENYQQEEYNEIKNLEKEVEDIKKEIEILKAEKQVEVHLIQEEGAVGSDVSSENVKKIRVAKDVVVSQGKDCEFYSLVDVEKVRLACRRRKRCAQ